MLQNRDREGLWKNPVGRPILAAAAFPGGFEPAKSRLRAGLPAPL